MKTIQVISFSTRDFEASIDIAHMVKVVAMPRLQAAPEAPSYIVGLMNLSGEVIPVVDLSMRLNVSVPEHYDLHTPILICKSSGDETMGVIVEKIADVSAVSEDMIQSNVPGKMNGKLVIGTIKFEESISLLINVDMLLEVESSKENIG